MNNALQKIRSIALSISIAIGVVIWIYTPIVIFPLLLLLLIWLMISVKGRQSLAILIANISTLNQRLGSVSVVVIGIAGVVAVLVALFAMANGFETTLQQTGNDNTAIVLRAGANTELASGLSHDAAVLISQTPGIARDTNDLPITSAEIVVTVNVPKRASSSDANVELRGVTDQVWVLRPNVKIVEGRKFKSGLRELIVGTGALQQFKLDLNTNIRLNNQDWTVVGVFDSHDAHNSELWGASSAISSAYRRDDVFQSVTVKLNEVGDFDKLKTALVADPRLTVDVETTRSYYNKQSERLAKLIRALGIGIAIIMGIGAIFGALNTMYTTISARTREIAMLRTLGFTNFPILVSILLEAMFLAMLGGILGALITYSIFNDYSVSTLGNNFSQVVFQFQISPFLLMQSIQWALGIGFLGGIFPALQATQISIATALQHA